MPNTAYDNFYLANEIEDQLKSHLDLQKFCTVDNSLQGTAGMKYIVNVYKATEGAEKLTEGQGNSKEIEVSFTPKEYEILLTQTRFKYTDEQELKDPMVVLTGTKQLGSDLYNTMNADIYKAFGETTLSHSANNFSFATFVNAVALMDIENIEDVSLFGFVHPSDEAKIRAELNTSLQYVEAFVRQGYIGTVAGINLYTKKDAKKNQIIIATKEAVTLFVKTGTEVETPPRDSDNANIRTNYIYARKYYVVALTHGNRAVKIEVTPGV